MKILKGKRKIIILGLVLIVLIGGGVSVALMFFGAESESESVPENQLVTVQRGNLTIDIAASGNLALSRTEDLAIDLFYGQSGAAGTKGTVGEVLVEEGDTVEEGQVLVTVDTAEWQDNLEELQDQIIAKERDLIQSEISLKNAERNLINYREALYSSQGDLIIGVDPLEMEILELQVELAKSRLEDDKRALEEAQEELDEALELSPEIIAPFDGFIVKVNVEGGDEVLKGTVAVQLADPNKFEADILVSEMDITQVKLVGEARVQIDAMPGLSIPAVVTHISPTAIIQSGVVNYQVKVEVQSLEAVMQERQAAQQEAMQKIAQGELPERLKQAIEEGQITQEQAEEMMKQMQQAQGQQQGQVLTAIPEGFQLREGLTVTVSIIVDERTDVLLVPNSAITTQERQTYVQVMSSDGTIEERAIQTGISSWQYTEVTSGLSEGEQVVVSQGAATTPTTSPTGGPPPMFFPPPGGRPR